MTTLTQERRCLICAYERHINRLIQVNLERQSFHVNVVFDGEEAIQRLGDTSTQFDLVVLDSAMPLRGGYEVLTWIRENEHTRGVKVVLMVASAEEREALKVAAHKADIYLVKPFNPLDMLR